MLGYRAPIIMGEVSVPWTALLSVPKSEQKACQDMPWSYGRPVSVARLVCACRALMHLASLPHGAGRASTNLVALPGSLDFSSTMTAATAQSVQYLNLAYFGRPADPASLGAFPQAGMTDEQIVAAFVQTNEYSVGTITPNSTSNPSGGVTYDDTSLINTFYQRIFGRLAASSEIAGWSAAIKSGAVNYDYLGITIVNAGLNLPAGTAMRDVLIAKFDSAQLWTGNLYNNAANAQAYTTAAAAAKGVEFLSGVTTSTPATVAAANAAVTAMVSAGATAYTSAFTLTSAADVLGPNSVTSTLKTTSGNDLFRAVADGHFTSADIIDGGLGSDKVDAVATAAGQTIKPLLTSVESVELAITAANTNDITVDLSDSKDVTSVKLTTVDAAANADDTEITLKGVATTDAVDLAMSAMTTGTLTSATVTYDAVTGTSDAATLSAAGKITDVLVAGIETATLNTTAFTGKFTF